MFEKYRHYFDIDPEYFPQVDEAIISNNPEIWKKYYPHETFVGLIRSTISVLSRKQKVSIWVEGAYGTGKSHAVLTLKKLLEASEADTREYFDKYNNQLNADLFNQFQQIKSGEAILTVHRYGSSSIHGDNSLVFAMQESIVRALSEKGYAHAGEGALKGAALQWLSDAANKSYFNELMKGQYANVFSGDTVEDLIKKLNTFSAESLQNLMAKVMKVAEERQFKALTLDVDGLIEWVKAVLRENNLKAIVFIWDEFTEYFRNNMRTLTGFQKIADLSGSEPFYLMLVTHNVTHIFPETDKDWKKILGRFIQPICEIMLPENMAFRLMGAAMEKSRDPQVQVEWQDTADELYDRTRDSRQLVKQKAHISDVELKSILPIHPYSALLLKHISSAFDSNQRSMFDFIKNDRGDEIKGFQWFISNCGPEDDNPLLTIDMLWDFFYEKGKEYLSTDIRSILDSYSRAVSAKLDKDDCRVLKTVLLLQAISQKAGDSVDLFIPNEKNVDNAFEGSDLENGAPTRLAEKLVRDGILYRKSLGGGKYQYSALVNAGDSAEIERLKKDQCLKSTSALVAEGEIASAITLSGALKLRYEVLFVSAGDFKTKINYLRNQESQLGNKIMAVVCLAKDDIESTSLGKSIQEAVRDNSYHIVFIDASVTPLGSDLLEQYAEAMANSVYQSGKDNKLSKQYDSNAKDALKKWRNRIAGGEFLVHTSDKPNGERFNTIDDLYSQLMAINKRRFPSGLETGGDVTDTMWTANSLAAGVECGATQSTSGQFRSSNPQTKLENYIGDDAWQAQGRYWEAKPYLLISKVKQCVEQIIADAFKESGRVSIARIFDVLRVEPFGLMPCNLSAFVLGFVLKEYTDGNFSYSDGMTNDALSVPKLKEMISEIIKHQTTPVLRYKDKYIVTMTEEEKAFNEASAIVWGIPLNLCTSVEQTRERIRQKMKELSFPMWCLKYVLDKVPTKNSPEIIGTLIDAYCGIANSQNFGQAKTDNDIAQTIGKLCMKHVDLSKDLESVRSTDHCVAGMDAYLHSFEDGVLISLAEEIGDNGQYINHLKKKFDADAANWVWNVEIVQQKIREVILEYKIIAASNRVLPKNINFDSTIREWCDRCNNIRISYLYAKNYWDDLAPLMDLLHTMKKAGTLLDSQRNAFLDQITINGEAFNMFYNNQDDMFKKACGYFLTGLPDDAIKEIYKALTVGVYTLDKAEYQQRVETAVKEYKDKVGAIKLRNLWVAKTSSDSPLAWSNTYRMPILAMVDDVDIQKARDAFDAINKKHRDNASVEKAVAFLEQATFLERLSSKAERDKAFVANVIKQYRVLLDDVEDVKAYLSKTITHCEPYEWYGLREVDNMLKLKAEAKYNGGGSDRALKKIDNMDVVDVKRYLKDLIRDNMIVGMEIIKGR